MIQPLNKFRINKNNFIITHVHMTRLRKNVDKLWHNISLFDQQRDIIAIVNERHDA